MHKKVPIERQRAIDVGALQLELIMKPFISYLRVYGKSAGSVRNLIGEKPSPTPTAGSDRPPAAAPASSRY